MLGSAKIAPAFCSVCIADIHGEPRLEPLGKNDALVAVCERCALMPVECDESRGIVRAEPTSDRAARIRSHRDDLKRRGICVGGESHGKATRGTICEMCYARNHRKDVTRRRGPNAARAR